MEKKASNKLVNVIRDKVRDTTIQAIQNCSHFMISYRCDFRKEETYASK